ncbi:hypothetical protein F4780DRAFT_285911 [Xylariomycetidae sp. FL0641]|nr:hypothetical protein F4780DRAFT_285911 [Xylariomycetidae sp. FL0641]
MARKMSLRWVASDVGLLPALVCFRRCWQEWAKRSVGHGHGSTIGKRNARESDVPTCPCDMKASLGLTDRARASETRFANTKTSQYLAGWPQRSRLVVDMLHPDLLLPTSGRGILELTGACGISRSLTCSYCILERCWVANRARRRLVSLPADTPDGGTSRLDHHLGWNALRILGVALQSTPTIADFHSQRIVRLANTILVHRGTTIGTGQPKATFMDFGFTRYVLTWKEGNVPISRYDVRR